METQTPPANDVQSFIFQQRFALENRIRSGMNWFFWIAGLSLVNSVAYLFGNSLTFVIGLGITQLVDGFMYGMSSDFSTGGFLIRLIGLVIDLVIAGLFVAAGIWGRKRYRVPIIIGMVVYALDGLILLLFGDFYGAGFHAFALLGIGTGLRSISDLEALEKAGDTASIESLRARIPSLQPPVTPGQRRTRWILIGMILLVFVIMAIIFR